MYREILIVLLMSSCSIYSVNIPKKVYSEKGFIMVYNQNYIPNIEKNDFKEIFFNRAKSLDINKKEYLDYLHSENLEIGFNTGITNDQILFLEKYMDTLKVNTSDYLLVVPVEFNYRRPLYKWHKNNEIEQENLKYYNRKLDIKYRYEPIVATKICYLT